MCKQGNTKILVINGVKRDIDKCLYDFVKMLNENGYTTVACCCGHGKRPSRISLKEDKELLFFNYNQAQKIAKLFPPLN